MQKNPKRHWAYNVLLCGFYSVLSYYILKESILCAAIWYFVYIGILIKLNYQECFAKGFCIALWILFATNLVYSISLALMNVILEQFPIQNQELLNLTSSTMTILFTALVTFLIRRKRQSGFAGIPTGYFVILTVVLIADELEMNLIDPILLEHANMEHYWQYLAAYALMALGILLQIGLLLLFIVMRNAEKEKRALAERYLGEQREHYEYLERRETETKKLRHDLRSHIYMLQELIGQMDQEALLEYTEQMQDRIEQYGTKFSVGYGIADAILNRYAAMADAEQVEMKVQGHFPIGCKIDAFTLCSVCSNMLSNAVEAASHCTEAVVNVKVSYDDEYVIFQVWNPYTGTIKVENGRIQTSKTDTGQHGYGLDNIASSVKANGGEMDIHTEDQIFRIRVLLRYEQQ